MAGAAGNEDRSAERTRPLLDNADPRDVTTPIRHR
jgi:hypothetical protein